MSISAAEQNLHLLRRVTITREVEIAIAIEIAEHALPHRYVWRLDHGLKCAVPISEVDVKTSVANVTGCGGGSNGHVEVSIVVKIRCHNLPASFVVGANGAVESGLLGERPVPASEKHTYRAIQLSSDEVQVTIAIQVRRHGKAGRDQAHHVRSLESSIPVAAEHDQVIARGAHNEVQVTVLVVIPHDVVPHRRRLNEQRRKRILCAPRK